MRNDTTGFVRNGGVEGIDTAVGEGVTNHGTADLIEVVGGF